jgi:U3 small nucleolar RNA-associated protein 11
MSSLRNAIKRKTHKERAQPTARRHLGLLEKHGDYKARADNFHKKERRLKALSERAKNRNPDEFYFGMGNSEVVDGKHKKTESAHFAEHMATLGPEAVKLMKTQDLKYLRAVVSRDKKKAERLKASLHFGTSAANKKTIFVDNEEEAFDRLGEIEEDDGDDDNDEEDIGFGSDGDEFGSGGEDGESDADSHDTPPAVAAADSEEAEYNLDLKELAAREAAPKTAKALKKEAKAHKKLERVLEREKDASYREMREREARKNKLEKALNMMEMEKNLAGKGTKRKIFDGDAKNPPVYKWKMKRKR